MTTSSTTERVALLERCLASTLAVGRSRAVEGEAEACFSSLVPVARSLRVLRDGLRAGEAGGARAALVEPPSADRIAMRVHRATLVERLLSPGIGADAGASASRALREIFVEERVGRVTLTARTAPVAPILEDALRPLVEAGLLAVTIGDIGADVARDVAAPVLVVPGPWSASDIRFQARHVASMLAPSGRFDDGVASIVITARGWLQREAFLEALYGALGSTAGNGSTAGSTFELSLDLSENEGPFLRERDHGGPSVARFLERATAITNEQGARSCCLLVHSSTRDDHPAPIAKAVADLRCEAIGINLAPSAARGLVHSSLRGEQAFAADHAEKLVVKAPFRIRPMPPGLREPTSRRALEQRLVAFEASPSWGTLFGVLRASVRRSTVRATGT